jgi:hypothetical protein
MNESDYPGMQRTPYQLHQFGGGGSGSTTQTQRFEPPGYTQQGWEDFLGQAQNLTSNPYQMYYGMQVAPQSQDTQLGQNMVQDIAFNSSPDVRSSRGAVTDITNGNYLNQSPYMNQQSAFVNQQSPYVSTPYVDNVIAQNATNMGNAAAIGNMANDDAMFARAGAYGGSAHQQRQQQNAATLENSVGHPHINAGIRLCLLGLEDNPNLAIAKSFLFMDQQAESLRVAIRPQSTIVHDESTPAHVHPAWVHFSVCDQRQCPPSRLRR